MNARRLRRDSRAGCRRGSLLSRDDGIRSALRPRRQLIAGLCAVLLLGKIAAPSFASATSAYPRGPIRLLVPHPPGGAADTAARIIAPHLAHALGQPVVVENRAGANGNLASETTARAAPDGQTLLLATDSQIVVNPHLGSDMHVDTLRDLVPVAAIGATQLVLVVNVTLPVHDLAEFVAYAKAADPPLAYASIGAGSTHHLVVEMLKVAAGIDLLHVPYRGGAPAAMALVRGEVMVMVGGNSVVAQIRAGQVRALAVVGRRRAASFPGLPTLSEHYPGVEAYSWLGMFAPAGLPEDVLAQLRAAIAQTLADPDIRRQFMTAGGIEPLAMPADEFSRLVASEHARYGRIVRALRIEAR